MKTAISIPDPLFEAADQVAKRLRVSRSKLYATALSQFVKGHRTNGVTELLNEVYGADPDCSRLDALVQSLQLHSISRDEW